ncbi:hypothetical protein MKX01_021264 [Papaver californicum]|nr:hypothetical protein MKX01_021264 [Papaver californicum]
MGKPSKAYDVALDFLNQAFEKVREIEMVELGQEHGKYMEEELSNDDSCASSPTKKILADPRILQTKGRKSDKAKEISEGNSLYKSGTESKKKDTAEHVNWLVTTLAIAQRKKKSRRMVM